jgi:hypothetical protein
MSVETVLERIEQEPVTIHLENGRLRVRTLEAAPADYSLPTDLVDALRDAVESLATPESLREFTERIRGLNAQRHINYLTEGRTLPKWTELHRKLASKWPAPEYYFCGYTARGGHPGPQYLHQTRDWEHDKENLGKVIPWWKPKVDPFMRNAWAALCSWADAHQHVAQAEKDIANRASKLNQSARADLSFYTRLIEPTEGSVIWYAMFDEDFFKLLINVKG